MRICSALLALCVMGCDGGGGADAGHDAGPLEDAGPIVVMCPTDTPEPTEQMGPCCYRTSNADKQAEPEMRLQYIELAEPAGTLSSSTLRTILNEAMQQETFNWLFRVSGADADGPVQIVTGFGRRQPDGTYAFSTGTGEDMPEWCPVTIEANLAGEVVASDELDGSITVPVFDDETGDLQLELELRQLAIEEVTWSEDRSCVGSRLNRPFSYAPAGTLTAYIEVAAARLGNINVPGVMTTVCAAIAGSLSDAAYCDQPQADWTTQPDSLCDAAGCETNTDGMTDVCDPASDCNAWRLVGNFAAAGVEVTGELCP